MGKKPRYRKVRKYYKSSEHYWRERNRRKLVLRLREEEFLSERQIADRLGVSERTVKRDLKKLKPYHERMVRHYMDVLRKQWDEKWEAELEGKNVTDQFRILGKKMAEYNKLLKQQEYQRHQIYVTINLDHIIGGYPELKIWPKKSTVGFTLPLTFNFLFVKNGETKPIHSFTLSYTK